MTELRCGFWYNLWQREDYNASTRDLFSEAQVQLARHNVTGRLAWRESVPQHFDAKGGLYPGSADSDGHSKSSTRCKPVRRRELPLARWRNALATPRVLAVANMRLLPAFDVALPRFESHPAHDCTHVCLDSALAANNLALTVHLLASMRRAALAKCS